MGMSGWILELQGKPEYREGYENPGAPSVYSGEAKQAFEMGQRDWRMDNEPRVEPDE